VGGFFVLNRAFSRAFEKHGPSFSTYVMNDSPCYKEYRNTPIFIVKATPKPANLSYLQPRLFILFNST
jgi:hypothetical protein